MLARAALRGRARVIPCVRPGARAGMASQEAGCGGGAAAPPPHPEPELVVARHGALLTVTLNRPRALNALTLGMVQGLHAAYAAANADAGVAVLLLRGAGGGRAFCAGGDVKAVAALGRDAATAPEALRFFREEYCMNYALSALRPPQVAALDGIVFGGGVGASAHGAFRVATERTLWAMPECAIGLHPDVGASHFLPRLPGGLGLWLGLTGARLAGADAARAGAATHYLPSAALPALEARLAALGAGAGRAEVAALLDGLAAAAGAAPPGRLTGLRRQIDECFGAGVASVEEVFERCRAAGGEFGADALAAMAKASPLSLKVTFELLRRGAAARGLRECLAMEHRLVARVLADRGGDFFEGVDAALGRKDGAPRWRHARLEDVSAAEVEALFAPLPPGEELELPCPEPRAPSRL